MHDYLTGGLSANTQLAQWCQNNGMLLHIHRAMHAVLDRNPHHGIHFRVLTKVLRLSGGDHLHSGTVVGKLEGDRDATLGWIDIMRDSCIKEDRSRGIFFDQDWGSMPGLSRLLPVVSAYGTCLRWSASSVMIPACSSAVAPWVTPGVTQPVQQPTVLPLRPVSRHVTGAVSWRRKVRIFLLPLPGTVLNWLLPWIPGKKSSSNLIPLTRSTSPTSKALPLDTYQAGLTGLAWL